MARATHILNVPIIGQRNNKECGNTVLTALLQYFGKHYNVTEVADLANTKKDGTDHGDLIAGAVKAGATVFAKSGGGGKAIREITDFVSRGLPVICGWWAMWPGEKFGDVGRDYDKSWSLKERIARDCGHYSVLRGYTSDTLLFMDPQDDFNGNTRGYVEYSDDEFLRVFYDTDTDQFELVKNWYMVINFEGRRFADELGGGEDFPARTGGKQSKAEPTADEARPAAKKSAKKAKAAKADAKADATPADENADNEKPAAKKGFLSGLIGGILGGKKGEKGEKSEKPADKPGKKSKKPAKKSDDAVAEPADKPAADKPADKPAKKSGAKQSGAKKPAKKSKSK